MNSDSLVGDAESSANQRPPPIPPFTWMGAYSPLLVVPLLMLIGVGMFAPDNVLDAWPVTKTFTNLIGSTFSWIGNHSQSTNYPQVALLITCMTVCLLVWTTCVFLLQSIVNYEVLLGNQQRHRTVFWGKSLLVVILTVPITFVILVFAFAIPGDVSWAKGFTTSSRAGFVFICCGFVYGGGLVNGGIPLLLRLLIDLDLRKRN